MNADAEAKIDELYEECFEYLSYEESHESIRSQLRKAMQFAYADAAKVCRDQLTFDPDNPGETYAKAIEDRSK